MKLDLKSIPEKLSTLGQRLSRYKVITFLLLVALVYGFVAFRISSLSDIQPGNDAINSQLRAIKPPRLDKTVIKQIQDLQDNSVSVKSLFNAARNNPFQE